MYDIQKSIAVSASINTHQLDLPVLNILCNSCKHNEAAAAAACIGVAYLWFCCFMPAYVSLLLSLAIVTRHTLVWKVILVTVFFLCPITDISTTVALIGVKVCVMVHIGPGPVFPILGAVPLGILQIRNFGPKFSPFDRECLENGKLQRSAN